MAAISFIFGVLTGVGFCLVMVAIMEGWNDRGDD